MAWPKLFADVNWIADPQSPTDLEKKHAPVMSAPSSVQAGELFDVTIEVGKMLPHPNELEHFIEFIELYADDRFLCRVDLTAETSSPKVTFRIALPGPTDELRAYERCNIHGVWASSQDMNVSE